MRLGLLSAVCYVLCFVYPAFLTHAQFDEKVSDLCPAVLGPTNEPLDSRRACRHPQTQT